MAEKEILYSGSTAITVFLRSTPQGRILHAANVGDARTVLEMNGKVMRLSRDHKGSDQDEIDRILKAGGFVAGNRVNGILAVTRALGDHAMKEYVISDPYCLDIPLAATDTGTLILACDGLWDVMSDEAALAYVRDQTDLQMAAQSLISHALELGSTDNISVMIIRF
eukprot:TRINITY_DN1487_c0_g1_i1.p2 TRINITY_DN1487_c0_g1~~TRINITY_DN1487_c0_g1_i1.p2  ORF type:complete len:167 (-),score=32.93 TRINITY_DN1487_c0_g1_i1:16-516(-)